MEEELFNVFKHIGGDPKMIIDTMMIQILGQLKDHAKSLEESIDKAISDISRSESSDKDKFNPFVILGVTFESSEEEVKKAYRKKATESHPDKGGSDERMKMVNLAYDVIKKFKGWI